MNTVVPSLAAETPPGVSRLRLVELRKMTDTRSGFWLLLSTIALTVAVAVVACLVFPADERSLLNFVAISLAPAGILLPVAGILLVTSEWSQRTAMITFARVPARSRVLTAKLLAGLALAAIAFVLCTIVGLLVTALAGARRRGDVGFVVGPDRPGRDLRRRPDPHGHRARVLAGGAQRRELKRGDPGITSTAGRACSPRLGYPRRPCASRSTSPMRASPRVARRSGSSPTGGSRSTGR